MSKLKDLRRWDHYYTEEEALEPFFPDIDVFDEFLKKHWDKLTENKAVIKTKFGIFVDLAIIDEAIIEQIGATK
jgi:hypothetical protein